MLNRFRTNLRIQVLFIFFMANVLPFFLTAILARRGNVEVLSASVINDQTRLLNAQAQILEYEILEPREEVRGMAQSQIAREFANIINRGGLADEEIINDFTKNLLSSMQRSIHSFIQVQVIDLEGNEVLEVLPTGEIEIEPDDNFSQESYFTEALALSFGETLISQYGLLRDNNEFVQPYQPVLHYSTLLYNTSGQATGVVIATINLEPFFTELQNQLNSGQLYIADINGAYIYHADATQRYSDLLGTTATLQTNFSEDVDRFTQELNGFVSDKPVLPTVLKFFSRVQHESAPNLNWIIVEQLDVNEVLAPIFRVQLFTFSMVTIVFVLTAVAMGFFLNRVLKPISQLATIADEVSRGNLNVKLPEIRSVNEISRLGNAFQAMLTEVKNTYGTLENRVRERTYELEQTNKELERSKNIAEEANRAKSAFLSNMSHELRTPLNVIVGYSNSMMKYPQMFDNQVLPDAYRPYAKLIEDNANYLIGLIGDVLDLSKIEAGKVELNFHTVDVVPLFRGIIDTANGLVKGKSVQIRAVYPNEIPVVWADERRLRQILLNLVSNAVKFTNTGSIVIRAVVDGKYLKISVIDGGTGISEEALQTIFDRFEQARQKDELRHQGTGLGLDISKHLAQMHGGDLTAESKLGVGSTFTLTLLLATEKQIETVQKTLSSSNTQIFSGDSIDYNTLHVVVVGQGDANIRDQLRESLEQEGFAVVDTYDGNEIMDLVTGLEPSLVILDENLQHRNGLEVVRDLREETTTYHIPLLFLTQRENSPSAKEFAIENILIKPFNIDDVIKKVKYIIANPVSN
jgi:signal transduction histidine kinase/CheY-like chemotaxis protein